MDGETQLISDYQNNGAVCLRGLFSDWVNVIAEGVEHNLNNPGPYFADNVSCDSSGRFWDDYCNWQRIPQFEVFIRQSDLAFWAAKLMQSNTTQLFHEHVLVKEPGTSKPTPWHQDAPYYFIDGEQTVSFWIPLDKVTKENTLELVSGSHKWPKLIRPVKWLDDADFYSSNEDYMSLPDINNEKGKFDILKWELEPGDAVAFHYRTVHGAAGNALKSRRRAFSVRMLGDDARYIERPGKTSPPFPGHEMTAGQRLREDWFPIIYR